MTHNVDTAILQSLQLCATSLLKLCMHVAFVHEFELICD